MGLAHPAGTEHGHTDVAGILEREAAHQNSLRGLVARHSAFNTFRTRSAIRPA